MASSSDFDAIPLNIVRRIIRRNQRNVSIAHKHGGSVTNADLFDDTASEYDEFVPATASDSHDNDDDHHGHYDSSVDLLTIPSTSSNTALSSRCTQRQRTRALPTPDADDHESMPPESAEDSDSNDQGPLQVQPHGRPRSRGRPAGLRARPQTPPRQWTGQRTK